LISSSLSSQTNSAFLKLTSTFQNKVIAAFRPITHSMKHFFSNTNFRKLSTNSN
jgi:hypothetical protein